MLSKQRILQRFRNIFANVLFMTMVMGENIVETLSLIPHQRLPPSLIYEYKGYQPPAKGWAFSRSTMEEWDAAGKLYFLPDKSQRIRRKTFLDDYKEQPLQNYWGDIYVINSQAKSSSCLEKNLQKKNFSLLEHLFFCSVQVLIPELFFGVQLVE